MVNLDHDKSVDALTSRPTMLKLLTIIAAAAALLPLVGCSWISPECKAARQQLAEIKVSTGYSPARWLDIENAEGAVRRWCKGPG